FAPRAEAKQSFPSTRTWTTGTTCGVPARPTVATRQTRSRETSFATSFFNRTALAMSDFRAVQAEDQSPEPRSRDELRVARPPGVEWEGPAVARRERKRDDARVVGGVRPQPVEPLHRRHAVAVERLAQEARILDRRIEPVKVDVDQRQPAARIVRHH